MAPRHLVTVSFDPGVTTGWAVHKWRIRVLLERGPVRAVHGMRWSCGQYRAGCTRANVDYAIDVARTAYEDIAEEDDLFVWTTEDFQLRMFSMDRELLEPVRFNERLEDRLYGTGEVLELQQPSDALTTITDARLGLWGLADGSKGRVHARDAQRHGLLYARRWCSDRRVRARSGYEEPSSVAPAVPPQTRRSVGGRL